MPRSPSKHPDRKVMVLPSALLLLLASAAQAHAACAVTTSGLAFGPYQPLSFAGKLVSADVTSTATISVTCDLVNGSLGYTLKLGPSPVGNSIQPRFMGNLAGGGNPMEFNVYTDPTHSTVWGNGFTGSLITHGPLNGKFNHTVYGKVPARQNTLRAGSFSSSLTITVTYDL